MTTAARPTWAPAKGGEEQGGARIFGPSQKFSSRDLASHTKLKVRKEGQETKDEVKKKDLREELYERERTHFKARERENADDRQKPSTTSLLDGPKTKRDVEEKLAPKNIDADDSDGDRGASDESSDDDDEDDTAQLLAELDRIKKERAEEKLRKERQQQEEDMKQREAELARGNPLVQQGAAFSVKRRWDDDVVFKNQTRGEAKTHKRFINDTIRSDFHRKFLSKYMK